MNGFFWHAGHLGWGLFALLVFSGLWCLLADVIWRLRQTVAVHLLGKLLLGWLLGAAMVVLVFALA